MNISNETSHSNKIIPEKGHVALSTRIVSTNFSIDSPDVLSAKTALHNYHSHKYSVHPQNVISTTVSCTYITCKNKFNKTTSRC